MRINKQRYWQRLLALAEITEPNKPYTRRSFSQLYLQGREWLGEQMEHLGLVTRIDTAGNLIGTWAGLNPDLKTILVGSHTDTVPNGGRFDGIAGVISALECIASWQEQGVRLNHNIEVIDFLAEEPSEWGISCVGSRGIAGFMTAELLATPHPQSAETLASAINRMGGNSQQLQKRDDIAAFFELHIEQGPLLEAEQKAVGIVSGIVGILRVEVDFLGHAGHAGTTSMQLRKDALTAAANLMTQINRRATQIADESDHYLVATCGQLSVHPNATNVVPGKAKLIFDIRSDDQKTLEDFFAEMTNIAQNCAEQASVELTGITRLTDTMPMVCDAALINTIKAVCETQQLAHRVMPSGAGHDAAFMSHLAPTAMIFVPSKEGRSHCPEEWTDAESLAIGTDVLRGAIEYFDQASG